VVTGIESMLKRRDVLKLTLGSVVSGLAVASSADPSQAQTAPVSPPPAAADAPGIAGPDIALGAPVPFAPGTVIEQARALSKKPFVPVAANLPDPFKTLSGDQYNSIRTVAAGRIWGSEQVGFAIEPLHRGFLFTNPVEINLVAQGESQRLPYNAKFFDYSSISLPPNLPDIGYSGFRVLAAQNPTDANDARFTEVASFQGANFFRALTQGQVPGLVSRALAVRLADPKGDTADRSNLAAWLTALSNAVPPARQQIATSPRLVEVTLRANQLVELTAMGQQALAYLGDGRKAASGWKEKQNQALEEIKKPSALVRFTILDGMSNLVQAVSE